MKIFLEYTKLPIFDKGLSGLNILNLNVQDLHWSAMRNAQEHHAH